MARQAIPAPARPDPPDDPVFFHKKQIRRGVVIRCFGRRDPGSLWRVTHIETVRTVGPGRLRVYAVDVVEHLHDMVTMQRAGTKIERRTRFGALSYSAIWRINQE